MHDHLRGEGVFEKLQKNVKKSPTDNIYGLCTLNSLNREHISDTISTAEDLGLKGIMFRADKWNKLQKIEGHEHDCGRPGINGGYIANPNVRFGINCYGNKPKITAKESKIMNEPNIFPKSKKEIEFENRVKYWKTKIKSILVSPFNHNNWSSFAF